MNRPEVHDEGLAQQDRSAWTFELDLRTSTEKW
jgi:hypothetical protein